MNLREQLLHVADLYCRHANVSRARVSTLVLSGGQRIDRIESGGDIATGTFERAMMWFSDNWPDNTVWPAEVIRPVPAGKEAAE